MYDAGKEEYYKPIFRIIHFYERLNLLYKYKEIDRKLAKEIFGELYQWWYEKYFIYQIQYFKQNNDPWEDWIIKYDWLLPKKYNDKFDIHPKADPLVLLTSENEKTVHRRVSPRFLLELEEGSEKGYRIKKTYEYEEERIEDKYFDEAYEWLKEKNRV